jgi:hypothetical protein
MSPVSDFQSPASSDAPISEVVRLVHDEFHGLLVQREGIERRIRDIHKVVTRLRQFVRQPVTYTRSDSPPRSPAFQYQTVESRHRIAQSWQCTHEPCPRVEPDQSLKLSRACRIALMEVDGPASLEQIRTRIVRREAFSFASQDGADELIVRVLNLMVRDGEVRYTDGTSGGRWDRFARLKGEDAVS